MSMCQVCMNTYVPKVHNAKFCNDICRSIAKKRTSCTWRNNQKDHLSLYSKRRYLIHKDKRIARDRVYKAKKMKEDPEYKLRQNLRKRLNCAMKKNTKSGSAVRDLGCSIVEFRIHLESKWQSGMSWDNYGRKKGVRCWEIDHITPLSTFNLEDREQLLKACNYSNLQPLWAKDNLSKGGKV